PYPPARCLVPRVRRLAGTTKIGMDFGPPLPQAPCRVVTSVFPLDRSPRPGHLPASTRPLVRRGCVAATNVTGSATSSAAHAASARCSSGPVNGAPRRQPITSNRGTIYRIGTTWPQASTEPERRRYKVRDSLGDQAGLNR